MEKPEKIRWTWTLIRCLDVWPKTAVFIEIQILVIDSIEEKYEGEDRRDDSDDIAEYNFYSLNWFLVASVNKCQGQYRPINDQQWVWVLELKSCLKSDYKLHWPPSVGIQTGDGHKNSKCPGNDYEIHLQPANNQIEKSCWALTNQQHWLESETSRSVLVTGGVTSPVEWSSQLNSPLSWPQLKKNLSWGQSIVPLLGLSLKSLLE